MSMAGQCWFVVAALASSARARIAARSRFPSDWLLEVSDELDLAQVAAMPVAGITAWMCVAQPRPDQCARPCADTGL